MARTYVVSHNFFEAFAETVPVYDALTPSAVATAAASVGTPALTQAHALTPTNAATQAASAGTPAIGQTHALVASSVATQAASVSNPTTGSEHVLTPSSVATSVATVGTPALTALSALTPDNVASAVASVGTPALYNSLMGLPVSDITLGSWTDQAGGTVLYTAIDETEASDADYIKTTVDSAQSDTCEVKLSGMSDAQLSAAHFVHVRFRKDLGASLGGGSLDVSLVQGTTIIASWNYPDIGASYVTVAPELTGVQADAITDYSDLRLRFTATGA